jgi:diguanylate cyclase (GGDEF)-like protein/PAS domain S-box-containing protein
MDGDRSPEATAETYRRLFESSPQPMWVYDADTLAFLAVNDAAVAAYGYLREEFLAMTLDDLALPHRGRARERRMRHRRGDGSVIDVEITSREVTFFGRKARLALAEDVTERLRATREIARRSRQQAAVAELGISALEGLDLSELLDAAVETLREVLDVDLCEVLELAEDRESFVLRAGAGFSDGLVRTRHAPIGSKFQAGFTLGSLGRVAVDDYVTETRFQPTPLLRDHDARSGISVIIGRKARPFGILGAYSVTPRAFGTDELSFLQAVANVVADAFARQASHDQIRHQALHDALTGLANRTLLLERLEHWLRHRQRGEARAAVLFIDLDNFKRINDALGHHVGDNLLVSVAARLGEMLRPADTLARVGGDEFVVFCEDIAGEDAALNVVTRLIGALEAPFRLADHEHHVTASIGIALSDRGATAASLLRDADAALYRAKERGRARCELFDDALREHSLKWLETERELRRALENDELVNVYQPIVSVASGAIVGFETLVRWVHPTRGTISPAEFVPVAEQTGLIVPLGLGVLERACRQAVEWDPELRVSVNLSPRQVTEPKLVESVDRILVETGLDPARLSLEITESVLIEETESALATLNRLRALGVRLELDDFGTGYSSLAYVKRFPIAALKIDRSFIDGLGRDAEDSAIVAAVISMARALGVDVVAEGVETPAQANGLRALGCSFAQGFFFSRPLTADALAELTAPSLAER